MAFPPSKDQAPEKKPAGPPQKSAPAPKAPAAPAAQVDPEQIAKLISLLEAILGQGDGQDQGDPLAGQAPPQVGGGMPAGLDPSMLQGMQGGQGGDLQGLSPDALRGQADDILTRCQQMFGGR